MNDYLYEALLFEIRKKFTKRSIMVKTLANILSIEKGAVYRRLRSDVPFTFNEIALVTKHLNISLDSIIQIEVQKSRPFQLKLPDFISPQEMDYYLIDSHTYFLRMVNQMENAEIASVSNVLPQDLFSSFHYLFQFNLFNWNYHNNDDKVKPFHHLSVPPGIESQFNTQCMEMKKFNKTHYVFDTKVFQHFINNLHYFNSIRLIEKEDVFKIKEDLLLLLDYLEETAITGQFKETGKEVNLYISDIDVTTNYGYIEAKNTYFSMIKAFLLTSVTSTDEKTFDRMKKWIHSFIKISTLITQTNEKQRVLYFEKQRKIVNEL